MAKNSIDIKVSDGLTNTFSISFTGGFMSRDHVTARVGEEVDGTGNPVFRTITWINDGLVTISGDIVPAGTQIEFRRTTPILTPVNDFTDGTVLTEASLDNGFDQAIKRLQEVEDTAGELALAEGIVDEARAAALNADIARAEAEAYANSSGSDAALADTARTAAQAAALQAEAASEEITPLDYGAVGDGVADDTAAVQESWIAAAAARKPVNMLGLEYRCTAEVTTRSNLTVHGNGAVMYIEAWPATGGFIHNVVPGDETARVQSNIRIYDLVTDGSGLPDPGPTENTNLGPEFAWGASNVRVINCTARYARLGNGAGTGGAGIGGEQGLDDVIFSGCVVHDCFRGVRVAGIPGNHPLGAERNATGVVFRDTVVRNCGTAVFAHSVGHDGDDSSDLGREDIVFDGLHIEDCGHAPYVDISDYPTISEQKSGVITLGGAHNVRFSNVRVKLNTDFQNNVDWMGRFGYPAVDSGLVGAGLSGPVGALVWGWGTNIVFDDITLDGQVDTLWKCARAVALGELASTSPTFTGGTADGRVQVTMNDVRVVRGLVSGYAFDAQDNLDISRFAGEMHIRLHAALSGGIIGPVGTAGLNNMLVYFHSSGGSVQFGTAAQWLVEGNAVATGKQTLYSLGGIDLGGGYSSVGSSTGLSYDPNVGIMRYSHTGDELHFVNAFYNQNGFVGSITTNGSSTSFSTTSDARLKTDLREFDGLGFVDQMNIYDFEWIASGERSYGLMAQELMGVVPDAVVQSDPAQRMTVDYSKLVPVLLQAVKTLHEKVKKLEN